MEIFRRIMDKVKKMLNGEVGDVFYVNGPDTLPPPLTREEEETVFAALSENDSQARNTLIVRNLRLVVYIAKKFESTGIGTEDLVSIGTIGLIKAVNTFCPDKNIKLATYASRCIENEILMHFRAKRRRAQDVSFSEPIDTDRDGNPLTYEDIISTDENMAEDLDRRMLADRALSYINTILSTRERQVVYLRYGLSGKKPKTQKETAAMLGISRSYV